MNSTTEMIKQICRDIETSADDLERREYGGDHITSVANSSAADAMRRIAGVIGFALIGTEDFQPDKGDDNA